MTRALGLFLAGVVLPVVLAVGGAVFLREEAARSLHEDAAARFARITGALLLREAAVGSGALPTPPGDERPGAPTADRVRAVLRAVERMAGYRTAVYLDGVRTWASDPAFGPDTLSPGTLGAVERGEHPAAPGEVEHGALVGLPGVDEGPSLAVLASPLVPRSASLPLANLLPVLTVAVILSVVAAWVLFQGPGEAVPEGASRRPGRMQTALVVLIPVLAGWALLGYLRRDLDGVVEELAVRELIRTIALVRDRIPDAPVEEVQAVTGFDATRIERGEVVATTLASPDLRAALAGSLPPPPGYTSSGRLEAPAAGARYLAFREPDGGVLALTTPDPDPRVRLYTVLLWFLAVVIALPGAAALLGGRLARSPEEEGRAGRPLSRSGSPR